MNATALKKMGYSCADYQYLPREEFDLLPREGRIEYGAGAFAVWAVYADGRRYRTDNNTTDTSDGR